VLYWRPLESCLKLGFVFPIYLFLLLPIAACAGDETYLPTAMLYDTGTWRAASKRKATDLHLGYLHPNPEATFQFQILELLLKVALPIITTETTRYPLLQTTLVASLYLISLILTAIWQPYLETKYLMLVIILKLYTVTVMIIGVVAVCIDDEQSLVPEIMVACTSAGAVVALMVLMMTVKLRSVEVAVYRDVRSSPGY